MEFAILVLPLVTLAFGIMAFGVIFAQQLALSNAAREAARLGSVTLYDGVTGSPHDCDAVVESARAIEAIAVNASDVSVKVIRTDTSGSTTVCQADAGLASTNSTTKPCTGSVGESQLQVRLEYTSELVVPLPVPGIGNTVDLSANGVFRCEYS